MKFKERFIVGLGGQRTYDIGNTTYIVKPVYRYENDETHLENGIGTNIEKFIKSEIVDFTKYLSCDTMASENVPTAGEEA